MVSYIEVKSYVKRALLFCVAVLVLAYVFDYLFFHYRAAHSAADSPYGTVSVYVASTKKNGQVELFYRTPQPTVCVNSLFPHLGYTPCWYLSRQPVITIS